MFRLFSVFYHSLFGLWRDCQLRGLLPATGMVAGETVRNYAGEINNRVTYNYDTLKVYHPRSAQVLHINRA